jgi:hypothetical protein
MDLYLDTEVRALQRRRSWGIVGWASDEHWRGLLQDLELEWENGYIYHGNSTVRGVVGRPGALAARCPSGRVVHKMVPKLGTRPSDAKIVEYTANLENCAREVMIYKELKSLKLPPGNPIPACLPVAVGECVLCADRSASELWSDTEMLLLVVDMVEVAWSLWFAIFFYPRLDGSLSQLFEADCVISFLLADPSAVRR